MAEAKPPHEPIVIPEPTGVLVEPWSAGGVWRRMRLFGPAAIVASVAMGAGETIIVVQAGSWAKYDLMWLVLLSVLVKGVCVTYLLGRYTAASGESIGQRLVHLPGPRGWLLLAIIVLELAATGPLWAVVARPCGDLLFHLLTLLTGAEALLGLSAATWPAILTTLFICLALLLSMELSFAWLERQQLIICGILVAGTLLGTIWVKPDLWAALMGCLRFGQLPAEIPAWAPETARTRPLLTMATTFGYVGGSVMGYIAYADWIGIHGWGLSGHPEIKAIRRRAAAGKPADYLPDDPASAARLHRLLAPLRWDVGLGAIVLWIVTASFMMAGAAVLYPRLASGEMDAAFVGWNLLTDQAHIWSNVHPALVWVYYVCVLVALWGTLQAFPEIYTRVTHEFCSAIWPKREWSFRRMQRWICLYILAAAMPFVWSRADFSTLTAIVAFLATNASVALAMLAALYLDFQLPKAYRTAPWMLAAGIASAAILVVVSAVNGWELVRVLGGL